jgi:hypothetical protein
VDVAQEAVVEPVKYAAAGYMTDWLHCCAKACRADMRGIEQQQAKLPDDAVGSTAGAGAACGAVCFCWDLQQAEAIWVAGRQ